jgi:hypothetical protein
MWFSFWVRPPTLDSHTERLPRSFAVEKSPLHSKCAERAGVLGVYWSLQSLAMERSAQIRALVYQALRKPLPPYTTQLQNLVTDVFQMAGEEFAGPNRTTIEDQIREIVGLTLKFRAGEPKEMFRIGPVVARNRIWVPPVVSPSGEKRKPRYR